MRSSSEARPDITVMTATYNGGKVLGRLLDALAAQEVDFKWEYVVVDNGSTDSTVGPLPVP